MSDPAEGSPPDLVVHSVTVSDTTLSRGDTFTVSAVTKNQGGTEAPGTTIVYRRSTNFLITTFDPPIGNDTVLDLDPGESETDSTSVTVDWGINSNWIGACVELVPGEPNADNNCSAGIRVSITN
ncbi:MAG: CARDB domain-containing protein [Pseudomonadota bacterium]